jgi:hypothetical protein
MKFCVFSGTQKLTLFKRARFPVKQRQCVCYLTKKLVLEFHPHLTQYIKLPSFEMYHLVLKNLLGHTLGG